MKLLEAIQAAYSSRSSLKAAPDAVKAYAAKVNSEGGINGRELVVEVFDTGTNDRGNARAYEEACEEVFAAVGSESAFDSGGRDSIRECAAYVLCSICSRPQSTCRRSRSRFNSSSSMNSWRASCSARTGWFR